MKRAILLGLIPVVAIIAGAVTMGMAILNWWEHNDHTAMGWFFLSVVITNLTKMYGGALFKRALAILDREEKDRGRLERALDKAHTHTGPPQVRQPW